MVSVTVLVHGQPEELSVKELAKLFDLSERAILQAVTAGKLPARIIRNAKGGVKTYAIRVADAMLVWGYRVVDRPATLN